MRYSLVEALRTVLSIRHVGKFGISIVVFVDIGIAVDIRVAIRTPDKSIEHTLWRDNCRLESAGSSLSSTHQHPPANQS
jgi:hypothetical protein